MFSTSEDIECILKFELLELIRLKPEPDYFFKLPEWSEADIVFLLDDEKYIPVLLKSIRAHIGAKTLRFTRVVQVNKGDAFTPVVGYMKFFFDPFIVYDWIIAQGLKWPESVTKWHDQQLKLSEEKPLKETEAAAPVSAYYSDDLKILIQASGKFWANAEKSEKESHPKNETVAAWLVEKGFSAINARQGATIIRPEWAAKGKY